MCNTTAELVYTYSALRRRALEFGGLYVTAMEELRRIDGAGRLSAGICDGISRDLAAHGLAHLPAALVADQKAPVRIVALGSPIGELYSAMNCPSGDGDKLLRRVSSFV